MASLQKRKLKNSIAYRIQYIYEKKYYTVYLKKGTSLSDARKKLTEINYLLSRGKNPKAKEKSDSLWNYYQWFISNKTLGKGKTISPKTMTAYRYAFERLFKCIGSELPTSEIHLYLSQIEKFFSQYSANSISIFIRSLRSAWNFGIERGKLQSNPFLKIHITKEKKDVGFWTPDEMDRIYNLLNDEAKKGFLLGRYAGLRKVEICRNVLWENINWDEGSGTVQAKTGENQYFVVFPVLKKYLKPFEGTGYVCNIKYDRLDKLIRKARIEADIKQKGAVKILRHSLAHSLLSQGIDIRFVQIILRHSTINTTQIYTNFKNSEIIQLLKDVKM